MTAYRSPLLDRPGAVDALGPDAGVAGHYGDPMREQRTLAERVGWVDRSHRGVLQVPGADRRTWLHSLTSQHLSELPDGQATEALVLSPHGHVEHHVQVAELADVTWLDSEPGRIGELATYLEAMRFWSQVEPREVTDDWALLSLVGPGTAEALVGLGRTEWLRPGEVAELAGGWVRRMTWPGPDAADLLVPRAELPTVAMRLSDAGVPPAGAWAFEALRVPARRPRLGLETDHRTIPHEVGWIGVAVHLNKGCYRGQETVARVHNLGRPPRRLVLVHLDGASETLPPAGSPVTLGERAVGFLGTTTHHYELGPVGLAMVKRTVADDAQLRIGDTAAAIDPAPLTAP